MMSDLFERPVDNCPRGRRTCDPLLCSWGCVLPAEEGGPAGPAGDEDLGGGGPRGPGGDRPDAQAHGPEAPRSR